MNPIRQFELVMKIAKYGSISKASKVLKISQPTLSKYLSNIEENFNCALFDRSTLPLKLTKQGECYLKNAENIVKTYKKMNKDILKITTGDKDEIKIGISPTRSRYLIPKITQKFYENNTKTKLIVKEKNVSSLISDLYNDDLDLIISFSCDNTKQFESIFLFNEEIYLAVPKKYKDLSVSEALEKLPVISCGLGLTMSNILSNLLDEYKKESVLIEAQSIELCASLANEDIGVTLLPSYINLYGEYKNLVFKALGKNFVSKFYTELNRDICVFYKKDKKFTKAQKDFIKICESFK